MNKTVENFTDIYRDVIYAIAKMLHKQNSFNEQEQLLLQRVPETIALINLIHQELNPFIKNFEYIESKKNFSYDQVITIVRCFHKGLLSIEKIVRVLFDYIIITSKTALTQEMIQKSKTVFHYQREVIKKAIITEHYKDIVMAISYIEFSFDKGVGWKMTFPVVLDLLIEKIEKMEVEINFLIEGISIVNKTKEFSYFDNILIMNRFHVGLLRIDVMIQLIKNMLVRAFVCIEKEQASECLSK